jgi:sigma-E factor negative regulatory protein RseB
MMLRLATLLVLPIASAVAQPNATAERSSAIEWLQRVYAATQKLSYTGTFVYQHRGQSETSRITRIVDGPVAREKLETLDGKRREVVRSGDEITCYLPASSTIMIDRHSGQRVFPAILSERLRDLSDNYVIHKGGVDRVAGYDCQVLTLEPKDNMRFGHKLWVDKGSGMLLKENTLNDRNEVMEQFAFVQLDIGGNIDKERVKSSFASKGRDWRVEDLGASAANLSLAGWTIRAKPPGFQKIAEMTRTLGATSGVGQMVFSDGLAAVSVFIEPSKARLAQEMPELMRHGAINVYVRQLGAYRITVVGEVPVESVRYIGNAVEFRKPQ